MKSKNNPGAARLLIVNADDFGLSPGVNAGVAEAHDHGILTSATLLANGPHFGEAVEMAVARPRLGVGVHLNIVRGRPLSPPAAVPLLVDGTGRFRPFRLRRMTTSFLAQAEREYRSQIEKILSAGLRPTHVDFEKHHAWLRPLYLLACRLAGDYGIGAVRTLREPVAWTVRKLGWPGWRAAAMAGMLRCGFDYGRMRPVLARPDRFLGQAHIGNMTEEKWLRLLRSVPEGSSEVMTHPGRMEEGGGGEMGESWLAHNRCAELDALLSAKVRQSVIDHQIRLITFADLPSPPA